MGRACRSFAARCDAVRAPVREVEIPEVFRFYWRIVILNLPSSAARVTYCLMRGCYVNVATIAPLRFWCSCVGSKSCRGHALLRLARASASSVGY